MRDRLVAVIRIYPQRKHYKNTQTNLPHEKPRIRRTLKAMAVSDQSWLIDDDHNIIQCRGCCTSISAHTEHVFQSQETKRKRKCFSMMAAVGEQQTSVT